MRPPTAPPRSLTAGTPKRPLCRTRTAALSPNPGSGTTGEASPRARSTEHRAPNEAKPGERGRRGWRRSHDCLHGVWPTVHVVAQEEIVGVRDLGPVRVEEASKQTGPKTSLKVFARNIPLNSY